MTSDQSAPRFGYQRRLVSVALTLGIVISTFYILSIGENFFVPLVMAVIAVYLVDVVSRVIRRFRIAGRMLPNVFSVILALSLASDLPWWKSLHKMPCT